MILLLACACQPESGGSTTQSTTGAESTTGSSSEAGTTTSGMVHFDSCAYSTSATTTGGLTTEPIGSTTQDEPVCGDAACEPGESPVDCWVDCGGDSLPPAIRGGCVHPWQGGSNVIGGPFTGATGMFAINEIGESPYGWGLVLAFFPPGVPTSPSAKYFEVLPNWRWEDGWWLRAGIVNGSRLTVTEMLGTWVVNDPCDPPRIKGVFERIEPGVGLEGPFEAVFCDRLGHYLFH